MEPRQPLKIGIPASWSGLDLLSFIVAMGGLVPGMLTAVSAAFLAFRNPGVIDEVVATLLSLAGLLGIPVFIFGAWMCWHQIGKRGFRYLALGLGTLSIAAWPVADYVAG